MFFLYSPNKPNFYLYEEIVTNLWLRIQSSSGCGKWYITVCKYFKWCCCFSSQSRRWPIDPHQGSTVDFFLPHGNKTAIKVIDTRTSESRKPVVLSWAWVCLWTIWTIYKVEGTFPNHNASKTRRHFVTPIQRVRNLMSEGRTTRAISWKAQHLNLQLCVRWFFLTDNEWKYGFVKKYKNVGITLKISQISSQLWKEADCTLQRLLTHSGSRIVFLYFRL